GPAGAIHRAQLIQRHDAAVARGVPGEKLGEVTIAVLEKAATVGAHGFSGAVMDPRALRELFPDYREQGCPIAADVSSDDVYVFGERGQFGLTVGRNPQAYATGVKELWELPPGRVQPGRVIHTMGWPLPNETFGGAFIYGVDDHRWAVGFVTGLDARDPTNDPHANLQRFKTHPLVRPLLEGGKPIAYGAKAIPEGGWWAMPKLTADGLLLCGDTGGFLNGARLKGIHLAIKSGMLAAETLFECLLAGDFSKERLAGYERRLERSWAAEEL